MFSRRQEQWELLKAIGDKDENAIRKLIKRGVNITDGDKTPVTFDTRRDYEKAKIQSIRRGIDLTDVKDGETPLIFATRKGFLQGIRVLIESGADIDGRDKAGRTALWWAAGEGNVDIARFLIAKGASVKGTSRCRPLTHAVEKGHLTMVELLVRSGADINGENVLYWAMVMDKLEIAELLMKNGADISNVATTDLQKLSSWATVNDRLDLVMLMLQKGVPVSLAAASWKGHLRIVTALLNSATDVDRGEALLNASTAGHLEIVKALLDNGADVNIEADSVLDDWGVSYGTGGQTPLMRAGENGHQAIVELLIERGANVKAEDEKGYTALTLASQGDHLGVVRALLNSGADANIAIHDSFYDQTSSYFGWTALMFAANRGDVAMVRLLIERGAILNTRDKKGHTALYHAQGEAKEVLEKAGAA